MKHTFLLLAAVILLPSCIKQTAFEKALTGDPIKPVVITQNNTTPDIADYLPALKDMQFDNVEMDELVCQWVYEKDGKRLTIPVVDMRERQHKQAMYVKEINNNEIVIDFTEPEETIAINVYWQNMLIFGFCPVGDETEVSIPLPTAKKCGYHKTGRSYIRIYAWTDRYNYNDLLIPLEDMKPVTDASKLTRHDPQTQVLYSLMIDRFRNGNKQNDWKMQARDVLDIVDYQGGDIAGITEKIESGFFDELGVSTLWISPITQNPWDAWGYYPFDFLPTENEDEIPMYNNKYDKTLDHTRFSGYHGYWPIFATQIDKRFGTDKELKQMLSAAHKHNINVILDYVANHMHINSPTLQEHPDWITDSILPDGRRNFELWDDARLTTWFDKHIPTLDLERKEVYEPMTDSALYWLENYEFDGFRHDACKHIPECYWRTLTQKMKERFPDRALWMIGETYGSPELIGSYVKTGMLDAQFDFNVYFTAIHAIVEESGDMRQVERVIEESLAAYGAHHTMGNISGNHDQVRFASLAGGAISFAEDGKLAGWTREVGIGNADIAYKKALLLEVLNMTIPGVPCVYQGDEYGETGGGDPDNRKMMRFEELSEQEAEMRETVASLIKQRRSSMAMLYGDYLPIYADKDVLCFKRVYGDETVTVALNKGETERSITVDDTEITVPAMNYKITK